MFNGKMGVTAAAWIATLISLQSNASGSDETIKAYDIAKKVWVDVMNGGMDSSSQNFILKDVTKLKNALSDELIIDSLNDHYGIEAISTPLLALGADINASVNKAETLEQLSYFVKLTASHNHSSIAIMDLLQKAGIEQIILPIKTLEGKPTLQIDDVTIIVYPFIAGQDGFSRALNDNQWRALGKTLRQIHGIDVPQSLQHDIRRETYSPKWREAVRMMLSRKETEHIDDEIAVKL